MKYPGTKPYSAMPVELVHKPDDNQVVTLPVPGFRQVRNYSCGYTAVLMVIRHFDCQIRGEELFEALGTTRQGTGQSAIINVLREQGLRAGLRYDMDFAGMQRAMDSGKVLIAYLNDEQHWLVLYGYGRAPQRVFVADPEPGKTCEQEWESYGHRLNGFAIVCSPRKAKTVSKPRLASERPPSSKQLPAQRGSDTALEQLSFDFASQS